MRLLVSSLTIIATAFASAADDPFQTSGNSTPVISKLTPEQEKEILKDVKVADGFEVSLFANSAAANYPVYVAASPAGDLYVSSDGNGSLGRDPKRGRIVRLRDTDRDGRADQVTEFVKDVDSPRGLVWDHDRLYLIHPPDVSCFIDKDGDGVAEEKQTLITGIAFGFKDRAADHTTNGLTLGIDGWLYISGGDFGFTEAVGTDGRRLQHRNGGVIRFRPDGSGMEIFSTGTRNILGTPVSPLLDLFARDNTNDGGGWDVRFHHFTGLEDHGYPRLYINFGDEIIKPVADYGGGSGCGSTYLSEPGIPEKWNNAPLTCDWGSNALWHHTLEPFGATFKETTAPQQLIRMTRPTDADVDGMSAIYQASWKGATFKWQGPDVGYIVRVTPSGYTPEPIPDFSKATGPELLKILESPSQVRTLEAQRALLRGPGIIGNGMDSDILALAGNPNKPLATRVAALYVLTQQAVKGSSNDALLKTIATLAKDPKLQRFVLRAMADAGLDQLPAGKTIAPLAPYAEGLKSSDPRTRLEAIIGAARQNMLVAAPFIAKSLGDSDPVIAHTAFQALARLRAVDAGFAVLDNPASSLAERTGASRALMRMHLPEVVKGLTDRLTTSRDLTRRAEISSILCRLYFQEGKWSGDSWGTRPDTRGPYYQPEPWSETPQIEAALKAELARATPDAVPALLTELARNRIELDDALARLFEVVKKQPAMLPDLVNQLSSAKTIPAQGIPALIVAVRGDWPSATISKAVIILAKTDSKEGCIATLDGLVKLAAAKDAGKDLKAASTAFLASPKLENQHGVLEEIAEKMQGPAAIWADAAVLALSVRNQGSPESRELTKKAVDQGWAQPKRRAQLLTAMRLTNFRSMDDKILAAASDPDSAVAAEAALTVKAFRLDKKAPDKSPLVGTLKPDEVVSAVLKTKGDLAIGEQMFARQTCVACHAVSASEVQKGPYLGNIAQTYGRADLVTNIIDPQKTIAQGFATEMFTLKDGSQQMGFVTLESSAEIKVRNIAGQESTLKTADITKRDKLPISMMPPGLASSMTVHEFASLLDYLESLAKKK